MTKTTTSNSSFSSTSKLATSHKPTFVFVMLSFLRLFGLIELVLLFLASLWRVRFNSHRTEVFRIEWPIIIS